MEDAVIEYTFQIKDEENILQEITVNSKSGAITDIEINRHNSDDNDRYDGKRQRKHAYTKNT